MAVGRNEDGKQCLLKRWLKMSGATAGGMRMEQCWLRLLGGVSEPCLPFIENLLVITSPFY